MPRSHIDENLSLVLQFTCTTATCTDGILDGFEMNVDCSGGCGGCGFGAAGDFDDDCASGSCANNTCY